MGILVEQGHEQLELCFQRFLRPWHNVYDELCAPAVGIIGDTMVVMGSTYSTNFTIWMSTNPKANDWKPLVDSFSIGGWDPAFLQTMMGGSICTMEAAIAGRCMV